MFVWIDLAVLVIAVLITVDDRRVNDKRAHAILVGATAPVSRRVLRQAERYEQSKPERAEYEAAKAAIKADREAAETAERERNEANAAAVAADKLRRQRERLAMQAKRG